MSAVEAFGSPRWSDSTIRVSWCFNLVASLAADDINMRADVLIDVRNIKEEFQQPPVVQIEMETF